MEKILNKNTLIVLLILVIGILVYLWQAGRYNLEEQENLVESLNADIHTWKDKDSLSHAKIRVIETAKTRDFLSLKTNDSLVMALQETVKDFKKYLKKHGSATIIKNETNINNNSVTEVIPEDTVRVGDTVLIYPVYKSKVNMKNWITGNTVANKDSTSLFLKVRNEYSVVIGEEREKWYKKAKPFVEVKNLNPYTETKAVRTYQVKLPRKKRFSFNVGAQAGYGYNFTGKEFGFYTGVGVGISYSIIRF